MMSRNPPPAPYRLNAVLPQHPYPYPPRQPYQPPETDVSYSSYSPSPSSLSAHRNKSGNIRNWAVHNAVPASGSRGVNMGIGSAAWSDTDTGTGMDDEATDVGTVPTTVKGKGNKEGQDGPRERVDVRKAMSARQGMGSGLQRQPSQRQVREEVEPSELPYRQSSLRRDPTSIPFARESTVQGRPRTPAPAGPPSGNARTSMPTDNVPKPSPATRPSVPNPLLNPGQPTMYTKTRPNKPTPLLAHPPSPNPPPDDLLVASPETIKPEHRKPLTPLKMREAYLDSALNLPLDMISQVEAETIGLAPPIQGNGGSKVARRISSVSSVLTTGRLASLVGRDNSPKGRGDMKKLAGDTAALLAGPAARGQMGSNRDTGIGQARDIKGNPMPSGSGTVPDPIRQAKSNVSSKTVGPSASTTRAVQIPPRSIGSAPALARSATVPTQIAPITAKPKTTPAPPAQTSALGLILGLPTTITSKTTIASTPTPPLPRAVTELQPAPHRQLGAIRRPALTPGNSTDNLASTLALGRRSRDPSMTDLRLRWEAHTYPLPESHTSVENVPTDVEQSPVKSTAMPTPKAKAEAAPVGRKDKGKGKEAAGALMSPQPLPARGQDRLNGLEQNAAFQLGRALAGKQKRLDDPTGGSLLPPVHIRDRPPALKHTSTSTSTRPTLIRRPATIPAPANLDVPSEDEAAMPAPYTTPPNSSAVNGNGLLSPTTPMSHIIVTPSPRFHGMATGESRHTLSRGSRLGAATDDDRVSFEVPNGAKGRLRVTLNWARGQGHGQPQSRLSRVQATPSTGAPPPLPPKDDQINRAPTPTPNMLPPPQRAIPKRYHVENGLGRDRQVRAPSPHLAHHRDPHTRPVTPPSPSPAPTPAPSSPAMTPTFGLFPPPQQQQQPQPYLLGPYSYPTLPTFRPAHLQQPFQLQMGHGVSQPFIYPQPQPPIGQGPAWTSLPHLANAQMQPQMPRQMGSAESFDPPSGSGVDSPRRQYMTLPGRGMGGPMGLPMGLPVGLQGGGNPYSTRSFNPNPGTIPNHEQFSYEHGQGQGHQSGGNSRQAQTHIGGFAPEFFGQRGNNSGESRWKRIFNGNFGNGNGDSNRNRQNQDWQANNQLFVHRDQAQPFHSQDANTQNHSGYGDREGGIGAWIRSITPGRAPTTFGGRVSSIWKRPKGRRNEIAHPDFAYGDDPFAHRVHGHTENHKPQMAELNREWDRDQQNGGIMNRFLSWPRRDRIQVPYETNGTRNGNGYTNTRDRNNRNHDRERERERGGARNTDRDRRRRRDAEQRNAQQRRDRSRRERRARQDERLGRAEGQNPWELFNRLAAAAAAVTARNGRQPAQGRKSKETSQTNRQPDGQRRLRRNWSQQLPDRRGTREGEGRRRTRGNVDTNRKADADAENALRLVKVFYS